MAGNRTEPRPREQPGRWEPFEVNPLRVEPLTQPKAVPARGFGDVLAARRSRLDGPIAWTAVGDVLWHATRATAAPAPGRAGILTHRRAYPSSGGLHPISIVCLGEEPEPPRLYDSDLHAFLHLNVDVAVRQQNREEVSGLLGRAPGCTLRFIGDASKLKAAYTDPESLLLRDAGALLATLCLCAEWLGVSARPLGFLGDDMARQLGFPAPRFVGLGGVQLSTP